MRRSCVPGLIAAVIVNAITLALAAFCNENALANYSITVYPFIDKDWENEQAQRKRDMEERARQAALPVPIISCGPFVLIKNRRTLLYPLEQLHDHRIVALLKVMPSAEYTLNEEGLADYGPIPTLQKLSISEAELIWGVGKKEVLKEQTVLETFDLSCSSAKPLLFYFDAVFKGEMLESYRVRCDDPTIKLSSQWHQLFRNGKVEGSTNDRR